jgi:hypothetical protein
MSRLYTGQHGEFFFWVQESLFGGTENFRIDQKGGAKGIEHKIQYLGSIAKKSGNDTTAEQRLTARRTAWERAGWVREASDDYPGTGDRFTADGDTAEPPSGWRWTKAPQAKISIPGKYRRIGTVRNWSFSNTAETIDTTTLGDTYRDKVGGLKSTTGQAQLMYYRDSDDTDSAISNMLDAFRYQDSETVRSELRVLFRLHHSSSGNRDFSFPALLTNWSMACSVGEVVTVDCTFESMGGMYNSKQGM